MNIGTFFMVYVRRALRGRRIPFDISAPLILIYSEENLAQIRKAEAHVQTGHVVIKFREELEAMASE